MIEHISKSGVQQIVGMTVVLFLASFAIILRLVVRIVKFKNIGVDDGLVTVAFGLSIAFFAFVIYQIQHGQSLSKTVLLPQEIETVQLTIFISLPIGLTSLTLTKVSVLFLYLRFFKGKKTRIATWVLMGLVICSGLYCIFTAINMCTPISAFWKVDGLVAGCMSRRSSWVLGSLTIVITDLATVILPIPILSSLKVSRRQRLTLMFAFGLGTFACVVSAVRLYELHLLARLHNTAKLDGAVAVLYSVEINIGIICSCLPPLRTTIMDAFTILRKRMTFRMAPIATSSDSETILGEDLETGDSNCTKRFHFATSEIKPLSGSEAMTMNADASGILRSIVITTTAEPRRNSFANDTVVLPDEIWDGSLDVVRTETSTSTGSRTGRSRGNTL